jgi:poly(hydroxyalkanoate) depolymerase family esterase
MARKLSSLFFSTATRMARLQRAVWYMGFPAGSPFAPAPPGVRRKKKTPAAPAPRTVALKTAADGIGDGAGFAGAWRSFVYRTPPGLGAWPVRLTYAVYAPPGVRKGAPMVVMLHGCEQNALDLARGTRMHRLADREGFLVVYPQQSRKGQRNRCWHWFQPDSAHGYAEADAIAGVIREAALRHAVDPERIYVAGLSAGAGMAAMVALRHPGMVAALGMHSGAVVGDAYTAAAGLRTMRRGTMRAPGELLAPMVVDPGGFPGMPAIIVQGQRDSVVDSRNGLQLLEQFAHLNGLSAQEGAPGRVYGAGTPREYVRHDVPAGRGALVRLCQVQTLGHAWSGGDGEIRFHSAHGPNASLLMWAFFKGRKRVLAAAAIP